MFLLDRLFAQDLFLRFRRIFLRKNVVFLLLGNVLGDLQKQISGGFLNRFSIGMCVLVADDPVAVGAVTWLLHLSLP